jgi:hypothetical protein
MGMQKATLFFDDNFQQGWTETFYTTADSPQAVLGTGGDWGSGRMGDLIGARRNVLGRAYYLRYARVSDESVRGDSLFEAFTDGQAKGRANLGNGTPINDEQVMDAINLRLGTADGKGRRAFLLRGLPYLSINQERKVAQTYKDLLDGQLGVQLTNGVWQIRRKTVPIWIEIVSISTTNNGRGLNVSTAGAPVGLAENTVIRIKGTNPFMSNTEGEWRIDRVQGNGFLTKPRLKNIVGVLNTPNVGKYAVVVPVLNNITQFQVLQATRKATGRPSYVPRGRRSVRRY